MIRKYGWKPDIPDIRDFPYKVKRFRLKPIPSKIDLRETGLVPPIVDQGGIGSCVGNATAKVLQFCILKQKQKDIDFSRLFIYYQGRLMAGTENEDSGMYIRDAVKVANRDGVCDEKLWKYDTSQFKKKPSETAYQEALNHQALKYERVARNHSDIGLRLAEGYPIVFGISVYDSFESQEVANTGIVPVPNGNAESLIGGHCVYMIGRDVYKKMYLCANSWGTDWGLKGFFWLPFQFIEDDNLSDDFWTITVME